MANLASNPTTLAPNTTGNVVSFTGTGTNWGAGTPGTPTFAIAPGGGGNAITAQTVNSATTATLTISVGAAGTVTISEPQNQTSCTIAVQTPAATSFTMTYPNPTGSMVGKNSGNFAVTPNGNYSGTITPSDGGNGGTFTPASLTWSGTSDTKTFVYKPSLAGNKTISATANPALTVPANIGFVAIASVLTHRDLFGGMQ